MSLMDNKQFGVAHGLAKENWKCLLMSSIFYTCEMVRKTHDIYYAFIAIGVRLSQI